MEFKSFEELYLKGCEINREPHLHINLYKDLDNLLKFMRTHESISFEIFKGCLNDKRYCIVIPYEMCIDKRLPPDDILDTGPAIFASPGMDIYRSLLIDKMNESEIAEDRKAEQTNQIVRKWKLIRLSRMLEMGWSEFCRNYIQKLEEQK